MPLLKNISIGISSDSRSFTAETFKAASALDALAASAAKMPSSGGGSFGGSLGASAGGIGDSTGDLAALGAQMRSALSGALTPLNTLASRLSDQFNRVGGTITTLARRIDAAIRFPATKRALDELQAALRSGIATASGVATASLTRLQRATLALGPSASRAISAYQAFNNIATIFSVLTNRADVARRPLDHLSKVSFDTPTTGVARLANQFRTVAPVVNTASTAVRGLGIQVGLALGVFGVVFKTVQAGIGFISGGIKSAASFAETLSKTRAILGDSSAAVESFAAEISSKFGLVRGEVLDAAASFGGLGKGIGELEGAALSDFSTQFTKLAADLQSFANTGTLAEATQALSIGLAGEQSDVLKKLGVIINETTIKQYALANGIHKVGGKLGEQAKFGIRAAMIMAKLADASGDLERTQDSAQNQFRKSGGGLSNFATTIGTILMPAVQKLTGAFNEVLAATIEIFDAGRSRIESWVASVVSAVEIAGSVVRNFGDYWQIAKLSALQSISNIISYIETIPANLMLIGAYLRDNWRAVMFDMYNATRTMSENIDKNLGGLFKSIQEFFTSGTWSFDWTPLLDGFQSTMAQLPELVKPSLISMDAEINAVSQRIAARESQRVKGIADLGRPEVPGAKAKEVGEKELKGTAAVEMGSAEAGSAIAKFMNKTTDDKPAKETAKNTADIAKSMRASLAYMMKAKESGSEVKRAIYSL